MTTVAGRNIHVARLRLRGPSGRDVAGFRNDLEDALRTATLPRQSSGSLIHIRHLDLGKLRRGISRQALSAHVERCLGNVPIHVLRWGAAPPPETAPIVQIPDIVTAATFALKSVVDDMPPHPAVVSIFPHLASAPTPAASIAQTLRWLIAACSAAGPGRIAELPGELDLMIRVLDTLTEAELSALGSPDLAVRHIPCVETPPGQPVVSTKTHQSDAPTAPLRPLSPAEIAGLTTGAPRAVTEAARRLVPLWGPADLRTATLLTWIAVAAEGPSAATRMPAHLARLIDAAARPRPTPPSEAPPDVEARRDRPIDPSAEAPVVRPVASQAAAPADRTDQPPAPDVATDATPNGTPHPHAGFWFLVPVLRHLACDKAELALGLPLFRAILARFAARLEPAEGDPIGDLFEPLPCKLTAPPSTAFGPHETVLKLLAGTRGLHAARHGAYTALTLRRATPFFAHPEAADLPPLRLRHANRPIRDPVTGFSLAAQRLIAQLLGGRGWRWLVDRPGRIVITPTHVDVTFDGATADADIRIAGFDLNPGWVPELGRVVQFHYDYSTLRDHGGWGE